MVDLDQPWRPAGIKHDVETKDLKYAARRCAEYGIGRDVAFVCRHKLWLHRQDSLHTEIHHIRPNFIDIVYEHMRHSSGINGVLHTLGAEEGQCGGGPCSFA